MLKGLTSDITGTADICRPVRDLSKSLATEYVLPGETILFALQSAKEEFAFTNLALIASVGANATTTRKLVTRYAYRTDTISHVKFETAGRVDRDCEIKFEIGRHDFSIDIDKHEEATALIYYKVLQLISRAQHKNARRWDLAKVALNASAEAMRLTEASGYTLTRQSDETLAWMEDMFERYNPTCYREVIADAFRDVQGTNKMVQP